MSMVDRQEGGEERPQTKEHISCMHSLSQTMSGKFSASQTFVTPALGKTLQGKASNSIGDPPPPIYIIHAPLSNEPAIIPLCVQYMLYVLHEYVHANT